MKKNNFCRFYIVRHGETEWNVLKKLQGHADSPLTEKGISDAQVLAKEFSARSFSKVFSSDLLRAHRTAKIIAKEHQLAVKTSQLLRERNFGAFEGKSLEVYLKELQSLLDQKNQLSDEEKIHFKEDPSIESDHEIIQRFTTFLREAAVAYAGKEVLVVSHSGMLKMLLVHLGFATYKELIGHTIKNLGYVVLDSDGVEFFIKETKGIEKNKPS